MVEMVKSENAFENILYQGAHIKHIMEQRELGQRVVGGLLTIPIRFSVFVKIGGSTFINFRHTSRS